MTQKFIVRGCRALSLSVTILDIIRFLPLYRGAMKKQLMSNIAPLSPLANAIWNATGCFFYLGCQWLITVLVVIFSDGFNDSGVLAYAMSVGNMFASISLYKVRTFQVSDIKKEYTSQNYIAFRIITVTISACLTVGYLAVMTQSLSTLSSSLLYLIFKADETFNDVLFGIDQCNERMDYIGKSQLLRGASTLIGFSVPLYISGSLHLALIGMATLCILVTLFYDCRVSGRFTEIKPKISKDAALKLAKACFFPTLANLFAVSIVSVVRQLYGNIEGETMLGIYASIATPAVLIQASAAYLYSPLIGSLSARLYDYGNRSFRKAFMKMLLLLVGALAVLVCVFSEIGQPALALLYGSDVVSYTWIFPNVLLSTAGVGILYFLNDCLIILRDGKTQILMNASAFILAIGVSTPFFTTFGMNGINLSIELACFFAAAIGLCRIVYLTSHNRA